MLGDRILGINDVPIANPDAGTYDRIRWEESLPVPSAGLRSSEGIPFAFAIPDDILVAGDPAAKGTIR